MVKVKALQPLDNVVGCHQLSEELVVHQVAGGAVLAVVALVPLPPRSAVVGQLLRNQAHHAVADRAALITSVHKRLSG